MRLLYKLSLLATLVGAIAVLADPQTDGAKINLRPPNGPPPQSGNSSAKLLKCSRLSVAMARQTIVRELDVVNNFNSIWFSDLDKDELVEDQKQSLASIIMSGANSNELLSPDGRPLFEVDASYLRPLNMNQLPASLIEGHNLSSSLWLSGQAHQNTASGSQPLTIKLTRKHVDRCYLHSAKSQYTYVIGLTLGPIEHNLDVVYNFGRELELSQPTKWRYAQVKLVVPRMNYEVTLKQMADYKLGAGSTSPAGCPLDVADVTYLGAGTGTAKPAQLAIVASGLASNNATLAQLERLFGDYTRPAISQRLRQLLKFYLSSKTLPLTVALG